MGVRKMGRLGEVALLLALFVLLANMIYYMRTMMRQAPMMKMKMWKRITKRRMQTPALHLRRPAEEGHHQHMVHRIKSSLLCATTRIAGSGWTGSLLRGMPGCLVSWDTGLDSENLGKKTGPGRATRALTLTLGRRSCSSLRKLKEPTTA